MFLRCHSRKKNGKRHRYWSVVESRRVAGGDPVQRQVLYLGEINDSQEAAWRKTLTVFDEQRQRVEQFALFPADRPLPPEEVNALSVVLTALRLLRPRSFGDGWLGCTLWEELGLSDFWDARLSAERGHVPWRKVLELLVVNRLCEPGSVPARRDRRASPLVRPQRHGRAAGQRPGAPGSPWRPRTGCTAAWIAFWRTRTSCAST